jgi:hypothetical protein
MLPGVTIELNGQRFVVAEYYGEVWERAIPLYNDLQRAMPPTGPDGKAIGDGDMVAAMRLRRQIAAITLAQNYPDMTPELVGRYLKLEDINAVIEAANEARIQARGESSGEAGAGNNKPALN